VPTPNEAEIPVQKERTYMLQCGPSTYQIICLEIKKDEGQSTIEYLIVPEFLIPGRPYPIYVYLHAIVLYSSNPTMGQRKAAEITRKRFGLETFSHTTLGRAMKKMEVFINENQPEREIEAKEPPQPSAKCFPTAESTGERRTTVLSYLKEASGQASQLTEEPSQPQTSINYRHPPYIGAFIDACHNVVEYTFKKYRRLLL
jgi:hypothetical protein